MSVRLKLAADLMTSCVSSEVRPFVALEHLESGTGRLVADAEVPERTAPDTGAASVEPGDVLFGKLRPYLAKTWLADRPVFASTELLCLRPRAQVDGRWLAYLVASSPVVEWAVATSDGTKMPRTSWEKLAEYRIEIPPLARQRAIADYLDREIARIDALIDKKQWMVGLLDDRRTATIASAFPGEMLIARDGSPLGFVDSTNVRLGALAAVQSGVTLYAGRDVGDHVTPVPYLRVANVQNGSILLTDVKEVVVPPGLAQRCALRRGDVLMTEGGDPDKLGRGAVWHGTIEPCLHQNHVFALRPGEGLDPGYLALLTRTPYARAYFEMTASKTTGIASTSTTKIASFRVPLLPLNRQRRIVGEIAASLSIIDQTEAQLRRQMDLLREHRQVVITEAVTGEEMAAA